MTKRTLLPLRPSRVLEAAVTVVYSHNKLPSPNNHNKEEKEEECLNRPL